MNKQIFVNLVVKDLEKSKKYFIELGYSFNPQFTDSNAACLVINEGSIYAMLLTENFFKSFVTKEIVDPKKSTEVLLALDCESKEEVDRIAEKILKAGGRSNKETQDLGFMYSRSMEDLDGHIWEYFWMDPKHLQN